jgi:hypothetical protein
MSLSRLEMIAFSKLGNYGRLGNQLFQYAFLRVTAERLGTQFFCPVWDGDRMFRLDDRDLRADQARGIVRRWGPGKQAGFAPEALQIQDQTDIEGFFQSEHYYPDKARVRGWFSFREPIVEEVQRRFEGLPWDECTSFSLRIDDDYNKTREYFPLYPVEYYSRALKQLKSSGPIVVFADRPDRAREFFARLETTRPLVFIDQLGAFEQLYAMTLCHDNVITNSTFAWWGAWLNPRPDKVVVTASEWCRPGIPEPIDGILCDDWVLVPGTAPLFDHFLVWRLRHPADTLERVYKRVSEKVRTPA